MGVLWNVKQKKSQSFVFLMNVLLEINGRFQVEIKKKICLKFSEFEYNNNERKVKEIRE